MVDVNPVAHAGGIPLKRLTLRKGKSKRARGITARQGCPKLQIADQGRESLDGYLRLANRGIQLNVEH
jgi:hypothetical protein